MKADKQTISKLQIKISEREAMIEWYRSELASRSLTIDELKAALAELKERRPIPGGPRRFTVVPSGETIE
jgi:hypothetical protein